MIRRYDYTSVFKWREKKLDVVETEDNECYHGFIESIDGDWVKYDDIKHLIEAGNKNIIIRTGTKNVLR
jgi:hypothetical protein